MGTSAVDDSTKTAQRKAKQDARNARPGHTNIGFDIGLNALVNRDATTAEDFGLPAFRLPLYQLQLALHVSPWPPGQPRAPAHRPRSCLFNNYMFDNNARLFPTPTNTLIQNEPNP
ncbi:MAG: hypothetical protein WKG07_00065 [Hymenobacter sp.]